MKITALLYDDLRLQDLPHYVLLQQQHFTNKVFLGALWQPNFVPSLNNLF
jgi:hypothetical protein